MIKKISIAILSLIVLFGVYVCTFASPINIVKSAFAKFPKIIDAKITHTAITTVSAIDRLLNAKISVDFGSYVSATAKIIYSVNGGSTQEEPVNEGKKINNNQDFYISLPQFSDTDTSVSYQIKIDLKDAVGNTAYAYWPSSDTSKFNTSQITSIASKVIGASGGTVELESGNQEIGNSAVTIQPGTFTSDIEVIIEEFDPNDEMFLSAKISKAKSVQERVRAYTITTVPAIETFSLPLTVQLSNDTKIIAKKFVLKYRKDNSIPWNKSEKIKINSIDTVQKLLFATVTKTGQYMIFVSSDLSDNDYRPENRVRVKSRISSYGGFKFNNLQEGDSVKIYTINGKKIAELTAGDAEGFEWKGRKGTNNSGDWAESGTYVYQIKVNGKLISGTIAFVW